MLIKEKIIKILESENPKTFEDFVEMYVRYNKDELSIMELSSIVIFLTNIIRVKGILSEHKKSLFEEQLRMTGMYLKGEMYSNEETARDMLYKQIENIEEVLRKNER